MERAFVQVRCISAFVSLFSTDDSGIRRRALTLNILTPHPTRSIPYLETLRATLDSAGFSATKIVAPDSGFSIANDINRDPKFAKAVDILGAHYPSMVSGPAAEATGKQLWASEEGETVE